MKLAGAVKPISYVKANMAEIIRKIEEDRQPVVITQNGEAKAVLMDVREFDQMRQDMAMMRILARSRQDVAEGRMSPAREVLENLQRKIRG